MQINEVVLTIEAIHKVNIENYEQSLDNAILAFRKLRLCEKELKELSLNAYKKYEDMEIPIEEYNKIIDSIVNYTIDEE